MEGKVPMTEDQWLDCTNPTPMLNFLRKAGWAGNRKLRLFAVACRRRSWRHFTDERCRAAVETSERYAEGLVGRRNSGRLGWKRGRRT
jgi:hypothetical protein